MTSGVYAEGSTDLEKTAIHEAGHAVACYLLKVALLSVDIVGDHDIGIAGRVSLPENVIFGRQRLGSDYFKRYLKTKLAGDAAELILLGRSSLADGSRADADYVLNMLWGWGREDDPTDEEIEAAKDNVSKMYAEVRKLLSEPSSQAAIRALANALLVKRRLSSRQARTVIRTALSNQPNDPARRATPQGD